MYLVHLKTAVTEALRTALGVTYIDTDFSATWVSIEYPAERQHYPGIWITYDDRDTLEIAGIDQREFLVDNTNATHEFTRWTFSGTITMTVVALTSFERDRLYDQLVRIFAFSRMEDAPSDFRTTIETNDFVGINVNWDVLRPGGDAASPGTPWGTEDEVIYEKSLSFDCIGEFVSDTSTNTMVILSRVEVMGVDSDAHPQPPLFTGQTPPPGGGIAFNPHVWQ